MLELELPDGTKVPSMALAVADAYRLSQGQKPVRRPPVNSRGMWYLPFYGTPGMLSESISLADVLSGEIPAEYFADAIVLIGPYARCS
jgi:adenylate cyclase